jgi:hypothetical protein
MVLVQNHQLTVRHETVVFSRSGDRDQHIVLTVKDECRGFQGLENGSKRPLVGIEEVPRVGHIEGEVVQKTEMGKTLVQSPERCQLQTVDRMVESIVTEELQLLDTNCGQQGK